MSFWTGFFEKIEHAWLVWVRERVNGCHMFWIDARTGTANVVELWRIYVARDMFVTPTVGQPKLLVCTNRSVAACVQSAEPDPAAILKLPNLTQKVCFGHSIRRS